MPKNDPQPRMHVEKATADQAQRMHGGLGRECPTRPVKPRMPVIAGNTARQRIAWMQVERNVEALDRVPERSVLRQVVIEGGASDLREAVDEHAPEAELLDAALKLSRRDVRVMHRKGRDADEAGRDR